MHFLEVHRRHWWSPESPLEPHCCELYLWSPDSCRGHRGLSQHSGAVASPSVSRKPSRCGCSESLPPLPERPLVLAQKRGFRVGRHKPTSRSVLRMRMFSSPAKHNKQHYKAAPCVTKTTLPSHGSRQGSGPGSTGRSRPPANCSWAPRFCHLQHFDHCICTDFRIVGAMPCPPAVICSEGRPVVCLIPHRPPSI